MSFGAKLTGDKALGRAFDALERGAQGKITRKATRAAAKVVQRRAKENALAASRSDKRTLEIAARTIKVRALKRSRVRLGHQVIVEGDAVAHIELGTSDTAPIPFLRRAFDESQNDAMRELETTAGREVDAAWRAR